MTLTAGHVSKRMNSTLIPTLSSTISNVRLKGSCSIINPVFILDRTQHSHSYNYVYAADFGRYYFVTDVVYDGALVEYHCRVDVLASNKTLIGSSTQYVLRSASSYDGTIIDSLYPCKTDPVIKTVTVDSPWITGASLQTANVVFGVAGAGGVKYYTMSRNIFSQFLELIMSDDYAQAAIGEFDLDANPQLKMLVDPLQYITSVTVMPFTIPSTAISSVEYIKVGYVNVRVYSAQGTPLMYELIRDSKTATIDFSLTSAGAFPRHPYASTRGKYLNMAPYSEYSIRVPGFGHFKLDPILMANAVNVIGYIQIDMKNGSSTMQLYAAVHDLPDQEYVLLTEIAGNVGITLQVSQLISPGYGAVQLAQSAGNVIGSLIRGDVIGAITGGTSAISDAAASNIPQINSIGSAGTVDRLVGDIELYAVFKIPVDDDLTQRGRPLCKPKKISSLSGYILCSNVELAGVGTADEEQHVRDLMEGGFFYE